MTSPDYTTGPRGLIRALKGDSNVDDIDAGFLAMATDVESNMLNYSSGLASAMPTAGTEGRFYRQTDTGRVYFDDGSYWRLVSIGNGGITVYTAGNVGIGGGQMWGPTVTLACTGRRLRLRSDFELTSGSNTGGALEMVYTLDGAHYLGGTLGTNYEFGWSTPVIGDSYRASYVGYCTPSAGNHTIGIYATCTAGAPATIGATSRQPWYLAVEELPF